MTEFTTEIYKIPASVYLKAEARDFAFRWGWLIVLPVIASAVAGFSDVRFAIIALMLVFVVIPPIIFIVYMSELLTPQAREALAWKQCRCVRDSRIEITYYKYIDEKFIPVSSRTVSLADVAAYGLTNRYFIIRLKDKSMRLFVPIPDNVPRDFFQEF